jgi:hypothetical protein
VKARPNVTATEIAEWGFCRHSWFLRRSGSQRSDEALGPLAAGADFQDQRDAVVITAMESQAQAKSAARLAWSAGVFFLLLVGPWLYFSLSRH